ncbi:MAG: hypothetical protein DWQ07_20760 [Chloroflexi bacterium]|nr:MAG: hypothetical protein DWQ07_20760 [Chloroflexota bacterium]MBL1194516.1 hypothetical protein [Chloroflexota bacterium]NOH11804.1 hypothetical protein [Chloroflexota bacterium]
MRFDRFDYTVWGVLGALVSLIAAILLLGDQVGVRVMSLAPATNSEAGAYGPIRIEFENAMQQESVEERFSLEPNVPGEFLWQGFELTFLPDEPLLPGNTYTARLAAGAESDEGRQLNEDVEWSFQVRQPRLVYLAPTNARELWLQDIDGGEAKQLTQTDGRVFDFAVSPLGDAILYSVVNTNDPTGIDLWLMDDEGQNQRLLVDCVLDRCSAPDWSPDGTQIAYSRVQAGLSPTEPYGPPRIWVADADTGETVRLFANTQKIGYGPSFSPDGSRLAYFDGAEGLIMVLNLESGEEISLPTSLGVVGSWSPDSARMVYSDTRIADRQAVGLVYLADFATQDILTILGEGGVSGDYGFVEWSPDGEWLLVKVRPPEIAPADELWIMPPDGRFGLVIADEANQSHYNYSWNPWSDAVLYQRLPLGVGAPTADVVVWFEETGEEIQITSDASQPAWLP